MTTTEQTETIVHRAPSKSDATAVWHLIQNCPPLDVNSGYSYLMLCDYFEDTCVVSEMDGAIVGFVSGFIPPAKPDTLFIWQVAVDGRARGKRLAANMIWNILSRKRCRNVKWLETTVTPSNEASRRMFQSVARALDTALKEEDHYDASLIPEDGHEAENLITIGPFAAPTK
jgi:L-2,4-diaminobutyric acid acetyltransferase